MMGVVSGTDEPTDGAAAAVVPEGGRAGAGRVEGGATVVGLHHVRLPVDDVWVSRDWYTAVLGFVAVLDVEEEDGPTGVVVRHPSGFVLGLHRDTARARALSGFAVLGLQVADRRALDAWAEHLDHLGVGHEPVAHGVLGWYVDVADPDGILVRLHCAESPDPEEA